ncbi:glycosyltransferase family 4 protein [bacterium AH-315-P07]|nr:glycosyltransferase family 4 protein [bacterium AH-315-P07]
MFDAADLFEQQGHRILYFSMDDPRNIPCDQAEYFVPNLDYKNTTLPQKVRHAKTILQRTFYSNEVKENLTKLIQEQKPDIAHIHLIYHHLSPSVLDALGDADIPIVQTVHDFKLICPNYKLYIPHKNEHCTRCVSGNYLHCIRHRCLNESYLASTLVAAEMTYHKRKGFYEKKVDRFICPSEFVYEHLKNSPIPTENLIHLPHHIKLDAYTPQEDRDNYLVFVGRLVPEKGIFTLIEAMQEHPDIPLKIIGDGPSETDCTALIKKLNLKNIELLGFQPRESLNKTLANATALIIPSQINETCGLTAWEAHALERPVIGANIGGIPETIDDGINGLLFEPGDRDDLARKIQSLIDDPDHAIQMGKTGRQKVEQNCKNHYEKLHQIYTDLT